MSLGNPIQVRLTLEKQFEYEQAAARAGKPLSTFLRETLEKADTTANALDEIRRGMAGLETLIEDFVLQSNGRNKNENEIKYRDIMEILLFLRFSSKPDIRKEVRAELERMGYN